MAKGDRVVVGDGYNWEPTSSKEGKPFHTFAYLPQLNEQNHHVVTPDGATIVVKAGGILVGSTGVISGPKIKVNRSYIHQFGGDQVAGLGNDFVELVPVALDKYQQTAYFPIDHIRIFSGAPQ